MKISRNWIADYVDFSELSNEAFEDLITTRVAEVDAVFESKSELSRSPDELDTVLEIDNKSLTHRPDLWSHFGFAREIAAILNKPLLKNPDNWADCSVEGRKLFENLGKGKANFSVKVAADSSCRRFAALEFANVSAKESPLWLRIRLNAIGVSSKNLLVDLSNYVMHDIGQPNHVYDADRLSGKTIYVRKAKSAETFVGLDGVSYNLDSADIAICDESGVIALGGIMGGDASSVSDKTTRLLLESANFDPATIRNSTKRHSLRTDASNRFEKSQSVYSVPLATGRFAELLTQIDPKVEIRGVVAEDFIEKQKEISIALDFSYIRARLGAEISDEKLSTILSSLSFRIAKEGDKRVVHVPYFRATRDINIIDDLVEEIGRIYGYENIPESIPEIQSVATPLQPLKKLVYQLKDSLCAMGFAECDSYSFMDYQHAKSLGYREEAIELENAIDAGQKHLRTSLVPAMLKNIETNVKLRSNFALFEYGRSYHKEEYASHSVLKLKKRYPNPACFERSLLTLAYLSGKKEAALAPSTYPELSSGADFFALLATIKRLVRSVSSAEIVVEQVEPSSKNYRAWMHPYRAAKLSIGKVVFAELAEVYPGLVNGLKSRAVLAELDLDLLLELDSEEQVFKPIARFPGSFFEMSVVVPEREQFSNLKSFLEKQVPSEVLKGLEVVAVYSGKPLKDGEKSISVRLSFRAEDRTLSGEELQKIQGDLMNAVEKSPYSLRS